MTLREEEIRKYMRAGRGVSEALCLARKIVKSGAYVEDICEQLEKAILSQNASLAFPCNLSINECAAHDTAEYGDRRVIGEEDVVKIDLGAHVDGYIADAAITISLSDRYGELVETVEYVLEKAIKLVKPNLPLNEIGRLVEGLSKRRGFIPISNLSGHSISRYSFHCGECIPNVSTFHLYAPRFKPGSAYAIEPFLTVKGGKGAVKESPRKNIFSVVQRRRLVNEQLNRFLEHLWVNYGSLPFAKRWLMKEFNPKFVEESLNFLERAKLVKSYPTLVEASGQVVAQAEHTVLVLEDRTIVITGGGERAASQSFSL